MPFKSKKTMRKRTAPTRKRTAPKRTFTRRNTNNRGNIRPGSSRPTVQRGYLPFGVQYFAKLPYVENSYITANGSTALSAIGYTYRANELFDPRVQVGGHQPMQYDIIAPVYERVWVHGCAVELTFSNPLRDGMYVGYRVRPSTNNVVTVGRDLEYMQEMRDSAIRPLNNTGSQKTTFKFYVSNHKVFGITKAQYANIEYSHVTNQNAGVHIFIEPFAFHTVAGETSIPVRFNIKITYYAQFTNAITAPQS